jgi:hypothetical protein
MTRDACSPIDKDTQMNTQATQSAVILAAAIIGIVLLQRTARMQARNLGLSPHVISAVTAGIGFALHS